MVSYPFSFTGWHHRLNRTARNASLPFYVLLTLLLREAKLVPLTVQCVSEGSLTRQRRQQYVKLDMELDALWTQYDEHEIVTEEFLQLVGSLYKEF